MEEATQAPTAAGLGARLRGARERLGLSVVQAAEKLHLEPRLVTALEAEDFDNVGASVYVRGHLQRYAELVGENAADLQALYAARPHAHAQPDLTQVITEKNRGAAAPAQRVGAWQGGLLTFVLVLVALVWWAMHTRPVAETTTTVATPAPATPGSAAAPAVARGAGAARPFATTEPPAQRVVPGAGVPTGRPAPVAVAPRPGAAAAPEAASTAATSTAPPLAAPTPAPALSAAATAPTRPAASVASAAGARAAHLELRFREDSWAEVYDATGARLYYDVAAAGATQSLSGVPPLRMVLGNAAGVSVRLDGHPVTLGAALQSTPNARFTLDRGGRVTETP